MLTTRNANLIGEHAHCPPLISVLLEVIKVLHVPGYTLSAISIYKHQKLSTSDST